MTKGPGDQVGSEAVKILGFLMTNVANKAMSARYGSNEILVSTSHSDMSH